MATYRYHFCDALTGTLLEELPLDCRSFSQAINAAGALTGTLALSDPVIASVWRAATTVKRTLLIVLRDEQIAWGGLLMKRRPTNDGGAAEITAETLEGYWSRRRIKSDLTYTATDVFDIVRGTVTQMQGLVGGDMRMAVTAGASGQTADVTYLGKDRAKALDAWTRLAEVAPGFELTVTWTRVGSVYTPTMTLAAPGLANGLDPILLEYPGNLISYDYPEDGTAAPNALTGIGADVGGAPLMVEVVDTAGELAAGVPLFEDEAQMKDESNLGRLTARTQSALAAGLADYVVPTADLRGDADPHLGDFPLGCAARLRATSLYHPAGVNGVPGLDVVRRVTGWSVVPGASEKVSLTLASTTGRITLPARRRDQATYLADLARRLRALETN